MRTIRRDATQPAQRRLRAWRDRRAPVPSVSPSAASLDGKTEVMFKPGSEESVQTGRLGTPAVPGQTRSARAQARSPRALETIGIHLNIALGLSNEVGPPQKSKLSAPILARFYSEALANSASVGEFVEAAKACAAFFTLWRTARTTSGLDDVYRRFFKGSEEPVLIDGQSWAERPGSISARCLKRYLLDVLEHKGIGGRDAWMVASERFLLYTEVKAVCRFVLFVAGHDRIADDDEPGLTKGGNVRVCPLLELRQWRSTAFRSLEHVAPQRRQVGHDGDDEIYNGDRVDEPGNLLLLPTDINQYADNKQWAVKYLYYSHVGERAQDKIDELRALARDRGYNLGAKTISVLSASEYNCVVEPVVGLGIDGEWNAELIDRRTRQMKEIVWDTLMSWLTSSPPT